MSNNYEQIINDVFDNNSSANIQEVSMIVDDVLEQLDSGALRVCEKINENWVVNQWIKKAILLSFRTKSNSTLSGPYATWFDKVAGKTADRDEDKYNLAGFRNVPNAVIRKSAFVAKDCIIMPSFINVGAYVDQGTMIAKLSLVALFRTSKNVK